MIIVLVVAAAGLNVVSCSSDNSIRSCMEQNATPWEPLPRGTDPEKLAQDLGTDVEHARNGIATLAACRPPLTLDQAWDVVSERTKILAKVSGRQDLCLVGSVPLGELYAKQHNPEALFDELLVLCAATDEELRNTLAKTT